MPDHVLLNHRLDRYHINPSVTDPKGGFRIPFGIILIFH